MLLKVERRAGNRYMDCELLDILRAMSVADREAVMGRQWRLSDLELMPYQFPLTFAHELRIFLPDETDNGDGVFIISGERLMERSVVLHQIEAGLFMRIVDPDMPVVLDNGYQLYAGPARLQASNVDLEIRRSSVHPYEIITADDRIIPYLQSVFAVSIEESRE